MDVYADTLSPDNRQVKAREVTDRADPPEREVLEAPFTMRYQVGPLELPTIGQKRLYTPHGPVVSLDKKRHIAYSVQWACDERRARVTITRLLGLERSTSAAEVAARVRTMLTPTLNIVAADVGGHVRYQTIGALPRRGFVPDPGPLPGDGHHEWLGLVPADSMPAWDVPPDQVVVNGNNLPARTFTEPLPRYGWVQERALRMAERLAGDPSLTPADARSVQNDVVSRTARRMVPLMLMHLDHAPAALTPRERAAVDSLRGWDFACRRSRVAPTVFRGWRPPRSMAGRPRRWSIRSRTAASRRPARCALRSTRPWCVSRRCSGPIRLAGRGAGRIARGSRTRCRGSIPGSRPRRWRWTGTT